MINVFLRGGLGNQLFQYAAGLFLAQTQDQQVIFRTDLLPAVTDSIGAVSRWPNQLSEFKCDSVMRHHWLQPAGSTHLLSKLLQALRSLSDLAPKLFLTLGVIAGERSPAPPFSKLPRIWHVDSYCSSAIPALALGESLRKQIRSIIDPSPLYLQLFEEAERAEPIIIHLRLGDYQNLKHLYGEPQYERIAAVIDSKKNAKKPTWLFTDSPEMVPEEVMSKLRPDKLIGPTDLDRPIENLVLLSMGSTLVCSNSTFSWWAAFLMGENTDVLYPEPEGLPHEVFSGDMAIEGWLSY